MNILILPGAETILSKQETDWIQKTIPGNEKVLVDAVDFAPVRQYRCSYT